jgi:putative membrane protein
LPFCTRWSKVAIPRRSIPPFLPERRLAEMGTWDLDPKTLCLLAVVALVYLRGWLRGKGRGEELAAFVAGLLTIFIALQSPLDTFDDLYLWVHMTQHILLMTAAPLLIMLGRPWHLLLRGLPRPLVKALAPVLAWPGLMNPVVAWLLFASSFILWHLPGFYQFALQSPFWHDVQHACFFWSGILFWHPVLAKPRWLIVPYLLFADILNTVFSAYLIFSGRLVYPLYRSVRAAGMTPMNDQILAGAIMWVPGSLFFLFPAFVIAFRLLGKPARLSSGASLRRETAARV